MTTTAVTVGAASDDQTQLNNAVEAHMTGAS